MLLNRYLQVTRPDSGSRPIRSPDIWSGQNHSRAKFAIITLVEQNIARINIKLPGSTQKCLLQHKIALFNTKVPSST